MSKVIPLIGFGVTLIGAGFFYHLFDDVIINYIAPYMLTDIYQTGRNFLWDLIPWLVILIGIFCLIAAGIMSTSTGTSGAKE